MDILVEILCLICERKMYEFFKKGEIVNIIIEWNKMLFCDVFLIDKFCEIVKKCLIESFDKVIDF